MTGTLSFTYDTLIAQIQDEAEDSSAELVANLPTIVSQGESRLLSDLNLEIFDRVRTGVLTAGQYVQPIKPATWQGTRSLHLRDPSTGEPIEINDPSNWQDEDETSPPEQYQAVEFDERYWWTDNSGFSANPGEIEFIGEELPAQITFTWEVTLQASGSDPIVISYSFNGVDYTDIELVGNGETGSGEFTVEIDGEAFFWLVRSEDADYFGTTGVALSAEAAAQEGEGLRRYLHQRTYEYCLDYEPDESATAEPSYFSEYSDTEFFMSPPPDVAYGFELREISQDSTTRLSSSQQTTWLATHVGDMLLDACMIAAEMYLQSESFDIDKWKKSYSEKLDTRRAILRQLVRDDYTPVNNAARSVEPKP